MIISSNIAIFRSNGLEMACILMEIMYTPGYKLAIHFSLIGSYIHMHTVYLIGISVFLYGLMAGYFTYSAFHNTLQPSHKTRRLLAAFAFGCVAVLLGWASVEIH